MLSRFMPAMAVLLLSLGGCATTTQQASTGFEAPKGEYKLVVMRPDIDVSVLTAGGQLEHREDWTDTATEHVLTSLRTEQAKRGGSTQVALTFAEAGTDETRLAELNRLHEVVGQSIRHHKYTPGLALPTKKGKFDWTLGELAIKYGADSGNDYALFLYAHDSFASSGRAALQAVSILGCVVGVCVIPEGGSQQAFASLVDLKTGNVVWFNYLQASAGDIRTAEGAEAMVGRLLGTMYGDTRKKNRA